jgi:hypothetical protein
MERRAVASAFIPLVCVFFLWAAGCHSQPQGSGSASFVASLGKALSSADITRVQLSVSASDISPPVTTDLVR